MGLYHSGPTSFGEQLAASIRRHPLGVSTLKVPKRANVYAAGDRDERVYLIESGLIKNPRGLPGRKTVSLICLHDL
jgi:hypothetical protein